MGNIITLDDPNVWKVIKDLLIKGWQVSITHHKTYTIHVVKNAREWDISEIDDDNGGVFTAEYKLDKDND